MRPYGETLKKHRKGVRTWRASTSGKIHVGKSVGSKKAARRWREEVGKGSPLSHCRRAGSDNRGAPDGGA